MAPEALPAFVPLFFLSTTTQRCSVAEAGDQRLPLSACSPYKTMDYHFQVGQEHEGFRTNPAQPKVVKSNELGPIMNYESN